MLLVGSPLPAHAAAQTAAIAAVDEPITPIPQPPAADPRRLALGERLFRDPRLSHDNTLACSSCHNIDANGASRHSSANSSEGSPHRHDTLTIFNAALSFRFSWTGKYRTLEEQLAATLANPRTMGSSPEAAAAKLQHDPAVAGQFLAAYGHGPDVPTVLDAIATFERSLLTPGSRFDQWLAGDATALSTRELEGYRLFKSLGCVSCHQGVNVGGNLFQHHGIFRPLAARDPVLLRVPSLRNVAVTPPYFHDGSAATLEEAVHKMGAAQLNADLSDLQVDELVAFLRTLTGHYRGRLVAEAR